MRPFFRPKLLAWIVAIGALGFVIWSDVRRAQRVIHVSGIEAEAAVIDPKSATGYADGKRWLIVPEHNSRSYQLIAETQLMFARGIGRLRWIDYENAPTGREVHSSSLYHWWLALVARCDHAWADRPLGLSVERAALWADPALHLLLLLGTTLFAARCFGPGTAALLALGLATLFPFASAFLPGVPDNHGLAQACALWSILPLLVGVSRSADGKRSGIACWFFLGGVVGGIGLWNNVANELPVLAGIALGGLLAIWVAPRPDKLTTLVSAVASPWRAWALGGALACLTGYLVEYFPGNMALHLQANHPLHGLAWLGAGELLALAGALRQTPRPARTCCSFLPPALAVLALAALPIAMSATGTGALLASDPLAPRLTHLANGPVAKNFATWLVRDGLSLSLLATCLPLLVLFPAVALLFLRQTAAAHRTALAVALGPAFVSLGIACAHLHWWSTLDATLLAMIPVGTAVLPTLPIAGRRFVWVCGGLAVVVGMFALAPVHSNVERDGFTRLELQSLLERGLAHSIADHAGGGDIIVLCPPDETPGLTFHGGFRGLGSPNWENRDGLAATTRIVSATTSDEAQALLAERQVTHLVLPSWDSELDEFVRWTLPRPEDSFLNAIHKWALPPWLRVRPYPVPNIAGFEGQSVTILEVTDNADRATSLSWLAEAALEMQRPELAAAASESLQAYPANLGALVTRALVEKSRGDDAAFAKFFASIESNLRAGGDRRLPWEGRVSLAVVLAESGSAALAQKQVERCLGEASEARLRELTPGSLFRLQVLAKTFHLPVRDERLRELALRLLPAELRARL